MTSTKLATTQSSISSRGLSLECFGRLMYGWLAGLPPATVIPFQMRAATEGKGKRSSRGAYGRQDHRLQSPGQDLIQGRTGNDSQLAELGYCPGEPPT